MITLWCAKGVDTGTLYVNSTGSTSREKSIDRYAESVRILGPWREAVDFVELELRECT